MTTKEMIPPSQAAGDALPRSTPEAQGIPSAAMLALIADAERKALGLHSLMLVRHGHVVAEGGGSLTGRRPAHVVFPQQELLFHGGGLGRGRGPAVAR